ncbi:MAG: hypothetical protein ACKO6B_00600 [Planctomycetia bacterium]
MNHVDRGGPKLLALLLLLSGSIGSRAGEPPAELPKGRVHFDGQIMELASVGSNDGLTLLEFIPADQTLDDWTSLAAIHAYGGRPVGLQQRADALVAQIRRAHPEAPIVSLDSPDSRQKVVCFALWDAGDATVEFNVFAFGAGSAGEEIGLQYAIRKRSEPRAFLQREFGPLRDRLVKLILRDGMKVFPASDLSSIRLTLSPADQAACDRLMEDDVAGLDAVLERSDERASLVLLTAAAIAFNRQRLEDSGFLFYAGQLRLRFDERCFPPRDQGEGNPVSAIRGYSVELGAGINPAVCDEPAAFSRALERVARWRPQVPDGYSPGYAYDRRLSAEEARVAAEPVRAEFLARMNDCATLMNDEDFFRAQRVAGRLLVPGEDRLPTGEEYAAARSTMRRIAEEKGIEVLQILEALGAD